MEELHDFYQKIENEKHRQRVQEILHWIKSNYDSLELVVKWNQPMFVYNKTFIIGFSVAKKHIAVAPEQACIKRFSDDIKELGYDHTQEIIRLPWDKEIDYNLLKNMIEFNIVDKQGYTKFWR